ncbi:MAG: class I SAM-dependent methyltransferase [Alphaproteobacteria bacterium]|nr:class I SAM-dependent methyltransferase [Alphaproteobacteria bacterium]
MTEKSRPIRTRAPHDDAPHQDADTIDFGYETIAASEKEGRVRQVFDSVASSYDVMNDVMSLGIHRLWKDTLINMINPKPDHHLIDLAGGTGDIAGRFLKRGGGSATIIDINVEMMLAGKQRPDLQKLTNLDWVAGNAEHIPVADASADVMTIAFGLRNVTNRLDALKDALRVLKPGGRFYCLEFSHVRSAPLARIYDLWSSALPGFGQVIARDSASYQYLVESIRKFPNQETLSAMFAEAGFARVKCRDLTMGIAAIHCGWKLD